MLRATIFALSLAVIACGRGADTTTPPPPAGADAPQSTPAKPTDPGRQTPRPTAPPLQPVDPEVLKSVLPEVIGWTRGTPRGEVMYTPVAFSKAEVRYTQGETSVQVEVQDTALNQMLLAGISMFLVSGFEETSDDGYKKSGTYGGHPGFEEWKRDLRRGEITIVVANRFVVTAVGRPIDKMDRLAPVVAAVDVARLASLK